MFKKCFSFLLLTILFLGCQDKNFIGDSKNELRKHVICTYDSHIYDEYVLVNDATVCYLMSLTTHKLLQKEPWVKIGQAGLHNSLTMPITVTTTNHQIFSTTATEATYLGEKMGRQKTIIFTGNIWLVTDNPTQSKTILKIDQETADYHPSLASYLIMFQHTDNEGVPKHYPEYAWISKKTRDKIKKLREN